jgi:hypothetical protein
MPEPEAWTAGDRFPWLVIDNEAYAFVCMRCGEEEPFDAPVRDLHIWTAAGIRFIEGHRKCKASRAKVEQEAMLG